MKYQIILRKHKFKWVYRGNWHGGTHGQKPIEYSLSLVPLSFHADLKYI